MLTFQPDALSSMFMMLVRMRQAILKCIDLPMLQDKIMLKSRLKGFREPEILKQPMMHPWLLDRLLSSVKRRVGWYSVLSIMGQQKAVILAFFPFVSSYHGSTVLKSF
jgi:hypothetical protein